jgi:hypothetical protein
MNGMGKEWFKNRIADTIKKCSDTKSHFLLALIVRKKSVNRSELEKEADK